MRLTEGFHVIKICIVPLIYSIDTTIQVYTAPCKAYLQYRQEQQYRNELCVVTTITLHRKPKKEPAQPPYRFPVRFYLFTRTLLGETPIFFGKTLYNLAK